MKNNLLFICLLLTLNSFSQKVTVEGTAFDTTKGRTWVTVILNDTAKKLLADTSIRRRNYMNLWKDTNYVVRATINGKFKIKAKKSDSLFFQSNRHITKSYLVADLLKMDKVNILLEPEVCEPYVACKDTMPEHFVFIGKKIKVDYTEEKYYCYVTQLDSKFNAEYKVMENVYGKFPKDTIQFVAYDHYGRPAFEGYLYVMLFVSKYCNELIHQKYLYYDVYETIDNKWAAPYQASEYSRLDTLSKIKPEKIMFKAPVEFDITKFTKERIEKLYPSPYYKIENGKAIAIYGNYVPELLELKKQTVLKARKVELK